MSYNALCQREQALISASAYHFGSYRRAVEQAGLVYADILRRPRWNKKQIIQLIKAGRRKGVDLHWSAITCRRDELGKAAFASLQPRLFGRWDRALQAAGLDPEEIARYRRWGPTEIIFELRQRRQDGQALNSGALQEEDPSLHAAAVRHYGSYDAALVAARLDPADIRQRRVWKKTEVISAIKLAHRNKQHLSDSSIRQHHPALYGAAVRLYGSFIRARQESGVPFMRADSKKRRQALPARSASRPRGKSASTNAGKSSVSTGKTANRRVRAKSAGQNHTSKTRVKNRRATRQK